MLSSVPDSMSMFKGMYGGTLPSACGGACAYSPAHMNVIFEKVAQVVIHKSKAFKRL